MKKSTHVLLMVFSLLYCLDAMAQSTDFSVPDHLQTRWQAIETASRKELNICLEHCGNDAGRIAQCRTAHQARLEREYQSLIHQHSTSDSSAARPVKPAESDKCPVCGMFVAKYPDWIDEIIFKDGTVVFFDGIKDLFKYYFNLAKYAPGRSEKDIAAIYVTEYYNMEMMDGFAAFYVIGSDVYGPMGRELIPFANNEDAEQFMKDHKGERILQFQEVTQSIIASLD
jgi:nitrous oxide reductase accessory protein NosL